MEKPRTGDRVRWTHTSVIEGRVDRVEADAIHLQDEASGRITACQFLDATVEVLERADDPSKALRGEVRQIDDMTAVCYGKDFWVYFSALHHGATGGYGVFKDEQMVGAPVIGVVPGTPAAEANPVPPAIVERVRELLGNGQFERAVQVVRGAVADMSLSAGKAFVEGLQERDAAVPRVRVPNEPHGIPNEVRQKIANHLRDGDLRTAVVVARNAGLDDMVALSYIKDMPEYQTYLNRNEKRETCTRDDCPAASRCSSGATVWHDRTPECGDAS